MNIYYKLEQKLSKYSIHNMHNYLVLVFLIGFLIFYINPNFYYDYCSLNIKMLLSGQIWRILTFIFYPPTFDSFVFLSLLVIYVYYNLIKNLLYNWDDFKFNFFYFGGMLWLILLGVVFYLITKINLLLTPTFLIFSIFIVFSLTYPDTTFLLLFIIPIKAKYLAIFEIILYLLLLPKVSISDRISIIASFINMFVFIYLTDRTTIFMIKNSIVDFIKKIKNNF